MLVVIIRGPVDQSDVTSRNTADRSLEAVANALLETADVEVVKVAVECGISVARLQMSVISLAEALSKEVTDVSIGN